MRQEGGPRYGGKGQRARWRSRSRCGLGAWGRVRSGGGGAFFDLVYRAEEGARYTLARGDRPVAVLIGFDDFQALTLALEGYTASLPA